MNMPITATLNKMCRKIISNGIDSKRKGVKKVTEKDVLLSSNNRPVMKKYINGQLFELNKTSFSVIFSHPSSCYRFHR